MSIRFLIVLKQMFGSNFIRPIDYHIRGKLFDPYKAVIESALIYIIVSTLPLSTTVKTDKLLDSVRAYCRPTL